MTLTLIRHKGELKPFGLLLAMRMLLEKGNRLRVTKDLCNKQQHS